MSKKANSFMIYQVYLGKRSILYDVCTQSVKDYCKRMGYHYIQQTRPYLEIKPDKKKTNRSVESYSKLGYLPIYEKENALKWLDDFKRVAVIDADVYIKKDCKEDLFSDISPYAHMAAMIEDHTMITESYRNKLVRYSAMQYGTSNLFKDMPWSDAHPKVALFRNMGVMIMSDRIKDVIGEMTPEEFIKQEDFKRFVDGLGHWKWSTDQTLLNYWILRDKLYMTDLHWKWNCLYGAVNSEAYQQANFIHFFLRDKLPNKGEDILEILKKENME